jgi:nucleoside-diphosphate-sugar epimerase
MPVLVMGATGNVGGAIVQALREREVAVTAVSRHERQWPSGVKGFVADPNAPEGLVPAAAGVDGAFLMSGYAAEPALLDALSDAHVVLLSSSSAQLGATATQWALTTSSLSKQCRRQDLPGPFFTHARFSPTCCAGVTNSTQAMSYARRSATHRQL